MVKFDLGSDDGVKPLTVNNQFNTTVPTSNQKKRKTTQPKSDGQNIFEFTD